jgi:predicted ATPase/DNA-binding SARP family transcriptional activator
MDLLDTRRRNGNREQLHPFQLAVLGKIEMARWGIPMMGLIYKKSLALLCYLAVTGHPHTRETLAGLLWGEATEANALAGLRKSLADLRRFVAPHLVITRQQVSFDRACPYWLDVEVFDLQVGEALETRERDGALTDEDAAALAGAVELYRGDFLAGFYVRRAPAFEDWVLAERERLRLSALRALHTLAAHYAARRAYAEGIEYTGRVLALEPGQEEAHRQMMSLLVLSGQQGAALRQYKTCRRVLAETWGVEPEEETTALYERIRDSGEPVARAQAPRSNLPASAIPLVGRETELAEIVARLQDPTCRLLTLVGPGGSGKTRLALEAGVRAGGGFADGVFFVPLAPLRSVEAILPALAQSLGFFFHEESDPLRQLLDYVRQKELLLVMDNFEHLLSPPSLPSPPWGGGDAARATFLPPVGGDRGGAGLVSNLLKVGPGVKILVTSRARLNLQSEHLFSVVGMDCPPSLASSPELGGTEGGLERRRQPPPPAPPPTLGEGRASLLELGQRGASPPALEGIEGGHWGQYSAIQLFLSSARRVQPGLELTADDLADVARICRLVEGMPLGILLAASWARVLTPAEIAARLSGDTVDGACDIDRGLDLLETDWRDVPARQRSMRAVFDHSWNLLAEHEREALAALSVFRGGFTHEAAQWVGSASLRDLMALTDQSLLQRASSGRYEVHELLRQYAEERLESRDGRGETDPQSPVRDRHSAYYADKLRAWAADLKGERQIVALEELGVEIANARAAWDWMASQSDVAGIDLALEGLGLFYEWHGRFQEGASACQAAALALSHGLGESNGETGTVKRVLARVLAWQGVFSKTERARQLFQESLTLLEDAELADRDTRSERAFILLRVGGLAEGDAPLLEQSLALYRGLDDRWGAAQALEALGWLAWNSGGYDSAERMYKECLVIYRTLGDQKRIAQASQWLGVVLLYQGQLEGERLVREGIAIYQEIGDRMGIAGGLNTAGVGLLSLGEFAEAHTFLEQGVALYNDLGISDPLANMWLGGAKVHLGQYEQGRAWGQTALDTARALDRSFVGFPLIVLGWAALVEGAYAEAQRLFRESADACQDAEQQELLSWVLAFLGYADRGLGQLAQAEGHLRQALQMAAEIESFVGLAFTLPGIALLLADLGQEERAVELYALASRYPVVANSRWFEDVVGRPVSAIAATLPLDVVAAAEERGRARDLDTTVAELLAELGE